MSIAKKLQSSLASYKGTVDAELGAQNLSSWNVSASGFTVDDIAPNIQFIDSDTDDFLVSYGDNDRYMNTAILTTTGGTFSWGNRISQYVYGGIKGTQALSTSSTNGFYIEGYSNSYKPTLHTLSLNTSSKSISEVTTYQLSTDGSYGFSNHSSENRLIKDVNGVYHLFGTTSSQYLYVQNFQVGTNGQVTSSSGTYYSIGLSVPYNEFHVYYIADADTFYVSYKYYNGSTWRGRIVPVTFNGSTYSTGNYRNCGDSFSSESRAAMPTLGYNPVTQTAYALGSYVGGNGGDGVVGVSAVEVASGTLTIGTPVNIDDNGFTTTQSSWNFFSTTTKRMDNYSSVEFEQVAGETVVVVSNYYNSTELWQIRSENNSITEQIKISSGLGSLYVKKNNSFVYDAENEKSIFLYGIYTGGNYKLAARHITAQIN